MNQTQIEATVLAVIATVLKRPLPHGAATDRHNTVEWDSLKHVEIMFALEDELATEFSEDELAQLDSVASIVAVVAGRHAA
ncbi:acyl carrier protein [Duganella qianjiadongensis]|uniref:Acyl carrier protein n=1 Tax=Duganella qianjiadongensis TaxID=2692176 RepID=A0ABW9VP77_9BURK|nr:acyl carrier protein [Duganella qianjiadongensis]MYM41216.1 acyl carrier protein [Duganella qianjiadongensis]